MNTDIDVTYIGKAANHTNPAFKRLLVILTKTMMDVTGDSSALCTTDPTYNKPVIKRPTDDGMCPCLY